MSGTQMEETVTVLRETLPGVLEWWRTLEWKIWRTLVGNISRSRTLTENTQGKKLMRKS